MSEIDKYLLAKILTALAYICNCEMNSLHISMYLSFIVLKYSIELTG